MMAVFHVITAFCICGFEFWNQIVCIFSHASFLTRLRELHGTGLERGILEHRLLEGRILEGRILESHMKIPHIGS